MRSVVIGRLDGPDSLELRHTPSSLKGTGEVLVRVEAVAPAFPAMLLSRVSIGRSL